MEGVGPAFRDDCFPEWINITKFQDGQQFFANNWGSIELVWSFLLVPLLAISPTSDTLLFTSINDCPSLNKRRYITTAENIRIWGTSNIRKPENVKVMESIQKVRNVHVYAGQRMRNAAISNGGTLGNQRLIANETLQDLVWAALKRDLEASYTPKELELSRCFRQGLKKYKHMNQFEYAMTQWIFAAMSAIDRARGLVPDASDENVENFNHIWENEE